MNQGRRGPGCWIGAGMLLMLLLIVGGVALWAGLNPKTQALIQSLGILGLGMILGILMAMSAVGFLLLRSLSWSVSGGGRSSAPATGPVLAPEWRLLPSGEEQKQEFEEPPRWRPARQFQVLGSDAPAAKPRLRQG